MIRFVFVLIAVVLCTLTSDVICSNDLSLFVTCNGQVQNFSKVGLKHIFLWHTKVSWYDAAHICRRIGGDLLLVESEEEMENISTYLLSQGYDGSAWFWTSGNDIVQNRKFLSLTNGLPLPYTSWSVGQPDNAGGNEHCVHLWLRDAAFRMNDWKCSEKAQVICQKQSDTSCASIFDVRSNFDVAL